MSFFFFSVYGAAGRLAAPALRRMLARRLARGKEIAERVPERYGIASLPRPAGRLIWVHAASVGETISVLPVIAALAAECEVLLTTGTVTSARLAAERLPAAARHHAVRHHAVRHHAVRHQFVPLDVPAWVAAFLNHWRPDCAVFVESEIWPEMLRRIDSRGIPRLLINARMSARSAARWRFLRRFAGILLYGFRWIHVQSPADAERFRVLGAGGILEWGNLKFSAPALPVNETALAALRAAISGPVWLAASTHEGEETIVIEAHRLLVQEFPGLVTIIVPRHPERGAEFSYPRRSLDQAPVGGEKYIADTLGELGLFYRLCPFAFVGGSLVPHGGQNIIEPARLGRPVITGPHLENFTEAATILRAQGALAEVTNAASLAAAARHWLENPGAAQTAGAAGAKAFDGLENLPARIAALILETAL
jgi:3-deoxy-D-manno-octulosonic-acid transferase